MDAITIHQPYATLTAQGARLYHACQHKLACPVRVAIHAAGAIVPPAQVLADAKGDPLLAQALQALGIDFAETMKALPCSAIVGVATLVRVVRVGDLAERPAMVGELADDDLVWEFADAVAIEPVTGVKGKVRPWTLDEATAREVAEREKAGERGNLAPAIAAEALAERAWAADPLNWEFADKGLEWRFRRTLRLYLIGHATQAAGMSGMVKIDRRKPIINELFAGMAEVRCDEFIRRLRLNMGVHHDQIRIVPRSAGQRDPWEKVEAEVDVGARKASDRARLEKLEAKMKALEERIARENGSELAEQLFEQYLAAEVELEAERDRQWDDGVHEREDAEVWAKERKWEEEQREKERRAGKPLEEPEPDDPDREPRASLSYDELLEILRASGLEPPGSGLGPQEG